MVLSVPAWPPPPGDSGLPQVMSLHFPLPSRLKQRKLPSSGFCPHFQHTRKVFCHSIIPHHACSLHLVPCQCNVSGHASHVGQRPCHNSCTEKPEGSEKARRQPRSTVHGCSWRALPLRRHGPELRKRVPVQMHRHRVCTPADKLFHSPLERFESPYIFLICPENPVTK